MKIEVNLKKKYFFSLLTILIVLSGALIVYAYNSSPGNASTFGHSANEIEVTLPNGNVVTLDYAVRNGLLGNGSNGGASISNYSFYAYSQFGWNHGLSPVYLGKHSFCAIGAHDSANRQYCYVFPIGLNWSLGLYTDKYTYQDSFITKDWYLITDSYNSYSSNMCSANCFDLPQNLGTSSSNGVTLNVSGTVTLQYTSISHVTWCESITGTGICGNNCWSPNCGNAYASCPGGQILTTPVITDTGVPDGSHGEIMRAFYKCVSFT